MTPTNTAAWLTANPSAPFTIGPAPYTRPGANEVVIRNHAVAINPIDHLKQYFGRLMYGHVPYPFVLGNDMAGEIVEVGHNVTRFQPGDRVIALALATEKTRNRAAEGAFQMYSVAMEKVTVKIPETVGFDEAVVLPLGLATAACGLFQSKTLGLRQPTTTVVTASTSSPSTDTPSLSEAPHKQKRSQIVLVWGGASSVGVNAIQLATAAGYIVYTTCSPHNNALVTSLGAKLAFDYKDFQKTVSGLTEAIASAVMRDGAEFAGAFAVGDSSGEGCVRVVGGLKDEMDRIGSQDQSTQHEKDRKKTTMTMATKMESTGQGNEGKDTRNDDINNDDNDDPKSRIAQKVILATIPWPSPSHLPPPPNSSSKILSLQTIRLLPTISRILTWAIHLLLLSKRNKVTLGFVNAGVIALDKSQEGNVDEEVVGPVFGAFLPEALGRGEYVCAPEGEIIGEMGLGGVQAGVERWKGGVSGRKVVVRL